MSLYTHQQGAQHVHFNFYSVVLYTEHRLKENFHGTGHGIGSCTGYGISADKS
jgi:hypothetical protein